MGYIWRSIVAEPKKTIDEYFTTIMEDLLLQAGSRLWRSRESSCLALADILQGRRFDEVRSKQCALQNVFNFFTFLCLDLM